MDLARRAEWLVDRPWRPVVLVALLVALPILVQGELSAVDARVRSQTAIAGTARQAATGAADQIAGRLDAITRAVANAAVRPVSGRATPLIAAIEKGDAVAVQAELDGILRSVDPVAYRLWILDKTSRVVAIAPFVSGLAGEDGSGRPYGSPTFAAITPEVSPPFLYIPEVELSPGPGSGNPSSARSGNSRRLNAAIGAPIGSSGSAVGHRLIALIDLRSVAGDALSPLGRTYEDAYLIDMSGRLLLRATRAYALDDAALADFSGSPAYQSVAAGRPVQGQPDPIDPRRTVQGSASVGTLGWSVLMLDPKTAAQELDAGLAQQRILRAALLAVLLIGAVLVGVAGNAAVRRRREAVSALEQQTATAAVLRAIAASPTNVDPVLDAIAENAARFCGAEDVSVLLVQGDEMPVVAHHGPIPSSTAGPLRLERTSIAGTAVLERRTVVVKDVTGPEGEPYPQARARVAATGQRGVMATPLIREGKAIGAILMRKLDTSGFDENQVKLVEAFADQAVIAIENVRLFNETKEALERQTAISEILRVMSSSPTDVQPVLDAIAKSAMRFCDAEHAIVNLTDGSTIRAVAGHLTVPEPFPLDRTTVTGRSMVDVRTYSIRDLADPSHADEFPLGHAQALRSGEHPIVATPMVRDGRSIGGLVLWRTEPREFTDKQIQLVETFARQAVIAIENVRLFNETKEALERQTAISEILRVMSASPTSEQPVLDAIADSARRFCAAEDATVALVDGDRLTARAHVGPLQPPQGLFALDRRTVTTRSIVDAATVHVADLQAEEEEFPIGSAQAKLAGQHTTLATPLLREGKAIGAILLRRSAISPFSDRQIDLLRTFADQAVIAIENVRLFNETAEALERQTAVAAVLKAISQTAFDLQAVFDVVVENATKLCRADFGYLFRRDGDLMRMVASAGGTAALNDYELAHPTPVGSNTLVGRAVQTRDTVHIRDFFHEPGYDWPANLEHGVHTGLAVPIFSGDDVVAVIGCARFTVAPYAVEEIRLLQTFASQAAIAIENARLFNETKEALEQQTAVADVLGAISQSAFDLGPVLQTVIDNAVRLSGADNGSIVRDLDGKVWTQVAHAGRFVDRDAYERAAVGRQLVPGRRSATGRVLAERHSIQIADIQTDPDYERFPEQHVASGARAILGVPLLRESAVIGVILLRRWTPGAFGEAQVKVVETFAAQAVIAIENVRLFNETKDALEQQTATSEVLKVISQATADVQPVFETMVALAGHLCGADSAYISRVDGDLVTWVASFGAPADAEALVGNSFRIANPRSTIVGRVWGERRVVQIVDAFEDAEWLAANAAVQAKSGVRTLLGVPMFRDGNVVGVMVVRRNRVLAFGEKDIALLETFAQQAAIAIENVRLFNETRESLERQTATAEVLKVISDTAFDLPKVLDTVISHATRLTGAEAGFVYQAEGEFLRMSSAFGERAQVMREWQRGHPIRIDNLGSSTGRAFAERRTVHIPDALADKTYTYHEAQQLGQFRTLLSVPLLQDGRSIGVIALWRTVVSPFSAMEIALVESFADQAVIAIQNVRLFDETREGLERQTAISEVLKVISRSTFQIEPVIDSVLSHAVRLCDADFAWMRWADASFTAYQTVARTPELTAAYEAARWVDPPVSPVTISAKSLMGRALRTKALLHIADVTADEELYRNSGSVRRTGARTVLAVPLFIEDDFVAVLILARQTVRLFSEREIEVLQTFADQAAIAIQNVRLFDEIQRKSAELEVANRHKSEFLANMSHELRTPLNAIIGFSEVLLQSIFGEVNEKQKEYLEDVLSSGKHLLSLINDILDLSKIEAGRMELDVATFSMANALDSGLTIVRERAIRHSITLSAVVPKGLPNIEADERKVKQILYNLLSNAVKFTPDGGRVDVRVSREDGSMRVEVTDTGIGIATEDQEGVFEEFRQVGRERSREGTGLGLTLTKRFVELHGGRIWFASEPGMGSTFSFTLPLRRPAEVKA